MKVKNVPVTFKAGPDDGLAEGEFIVYPSTFTKTPDSYGDIVAPGAFLDDIQAWKDAGHVLPGLFGHRLDDPDFYVASAIDEGEDEHGWWVKGAFDMESPKGPQVYRLVKSKRLNQLSFAYEVLDEAEVELEDGTKANELRKVKRHEFSFVPVGANQDTSVAAIKGAADALVATPEFKAGRVLSSKNEAELRKAHEAIGNVLSAIGQDEETEDDDEKASGTDEAKVDDTTEEPKSSPSARLTTARANIYARMRAGE